MQRSRLARLLCHGNPRLKPGLVYLHSSLASCGIPLSWTEYYSLVETGGFHSLWFWEAFERVLSMDLPTLVLALYIPLGSILEQLAEGCLLQHCLLATFQQAPGHLVLS